MPHRIIGKAKHIKVQIGGDRQQSAKEPCIERVLTSHIQMQDDFGIGCRGCSNTSNRRFQESGKIGKILISVANLAIIMKYARGYLIANLNHFRNNACRRKVVQRVFHVVVQCSLQFGVRQIFPCLGFNLVGRVCPEVTQVEINQHSHSEVFCPPCQRQSGCIIIITTTIRISVFVVWIYP